LEGRINQFEWILQDSKLYLEPKYLFRESDK